MNLEVLGQEMSKAHATAKAGDHQQLLAHLALEGHQEDCGGSGHTETWSGFWSWGHTL